MRNRAALAALLAIGSLAAGCLQVDLGIELHDDGAATLTERLRLSAALLDLAPGMARHLKREAAAERMQRMGQGMTLESHAEGRIADGSLESVAVFRIAAVDDLRLANPFVQDRKPAPMMRLEFKPIYHNPSQPRTVGNVIVRLVPAEPRAQPPDGAAEADAETPALPPESAEESAAAAPAAPETPLELQGYRHLQSLFADVMKDFAVKVSLTAPNQPTGGGRPAGATTIRLLSFTGADLDRQAVPFLENEEAMLALLQFKLSDPAILTHTVEFPRYRQVPVHRGRRPYASTQFQILPTRQLFQKYFAGRPKAEGGDR
jgi:hypothetical protein